MAIDEKIKDETQKLRNDLNREEVKISVYLLVQVK